MNKKSFLLLVSLLVYLSHADTLTYLGPSKYSVQLRTTALLSISSLIPGTMISLKNMINSVDGYRVSIGINAGMLNTTDEIQNNKTTEILSDSLSISLHVSYLRYLYHNRNMYLYVGIGPFGKYEYNYFKTFLEAKTISNYTIGIDAFPGLEWFIIQHLSLLAEYNLNIHYQYTLNKTEMSGSNFQVPIQKTHAIKLEYYSVFIGLSLYL